MSTIKRYIVEDSLKDYSVTLEVDHSILTKERATEINNFWLDSEWRIRDEDGDVVRAVIRLAGDRLINIMLYQGAGEFTERTYDSPGPLWTRDLHDEEGWGGSAKWGPFGWCGIRCVAGSVERPTWDDLELTEITGSELA